MNKISKLQIANEMYKMAFLVKKNKFAQENPQLSPAELQKKTIEYFKTLPKD